MSVTDNTHLPWALTEQGEKVERAGDGCNRAKQRVPPPPPIMANTTVAGAKAIHGQNPQVDCVIRGCKRKY